MAKHDQELAAEMTVALINRMEDMSYTSLSSTAEQVAKAYEMILTAVVTHTPVSIARQQRGASQE